MHSDQFIEALYRLKVGCVGDGTARHERPHKPLLLLVVLEMLDAGTATPDRIPWNAELRERFSRKFELVAKKNDQDSPENPFHYLASDGFWEPYRIKDGREALCNELPLVRDSGCVFARFVSGVDLLVSQAGLRAQFAQALTSRYFPSAGAKLLGDATMKISTSCEVREEEAETLSGRSAGFRKAVTEAYDFQCAACGLRIKIGSLDVSFVDAAHLIPFSDSRNDHPTNGIALCKNHHWAMDRHLIAPAPEGVWKVSSCLLAKRSTGEKELRALHEQELIPPVDPAYQPSQAGLRWRVDRLIA